MQAASKAPLLKSLIIQGRVLGALLMRETITRYGRYNIGFLWVFVEPMIFTAGITLLWNLYHHGHLPKGLSVTAFAYTGYSTVMLWRNAGNRCTKAIEPNQALLFHNRVRVIDLFYARVMLETAGGTISGFVVGLALVATGLMEMPRDVLYMLLAWLLLIWYTFGVGLIAGALSERWDAFDRIYHPALYFFLPVSGAFYMVDWLPNSVKKYAVWVPTVTVTEMLRHGYWGDAVRTYEQPAYLSVLCLIMLFLGLILAKLAGYRVEPQ